MSLNVFQSIGAYEISPMGIRSLNARLRRLEDRFRQHRRQEDTLRSLQESEPAAIMRKAGFEPDPWQQQLLASTLSQILLLCSRQAGKSTTAAALALRTALFQPDAPVLLLSPSLRQSGELFRKVLMLFRSLGEPAGVVAASALRLELANGSRILSLPGTESTIRGFSGVTLLIIDEAARVSDVLYAAVRPMLAVSQGRLVALSTPFGKRGWFYDSWESGGSWERIRITAPQCPRIPSDFLAREQLALGERWYRQEYLCSFEDTVGSLFSDEDIRKAFDCDEKPFDFLS